ncbi:two-component system response regulator [Methylococcaceae bacterium WWC4]|nr:two-component system response regulator [Methylococcaceae bacterium WWC4]
MITPASTEPATILIVDDMPENLHILGTLLQGAGYRVKAANSGAAALRYANQTPSPDLILLDVMMPELDGYQVLTRLKAAPGSADIPVIFLTALDDARDEQYGLQLGAADYIAKPIQPAVVLTRVAAQLEAKRARDWLADQNAFLENEIGKRMAENELTQNVSILALAHLAETRDPETGQHLLRTQGYVRTLAECLRDHPRFSQTLTPNYIKLLTRSAPLHDIGKVGIPDYILTKPGKLTAAEWEIMKTHAKLGSDAIERAERDVRASAAFLALAKEIAHWHHEKWDGSGYPEGLQGEAIPVSARIMALADVFDALISQRSYKPPIDFGEAADIIMAGRGRHFDPDIADGFAHCLENFKMIATEFRDPL